MPARLRLHPVGVSIAATAVAGDAPDGGPEDDELGTERCRLDALGRQTTQRRGNRRRARDNSSLRNGQPRQPGPDRRSLRRRCRRGGLAIGPLGRVDLAATSRSRAPSATKSRVRSGWSTPAARACSAASRRRRTSSANAAPDRSFVGRRVAQRTTSRGSPGVDGVLGEHRGRSPRPRRRRTSAAAAVQSRPLGEAETLVRGKPEEVMAELDVASASQRTNSASRAQTSSGADRRDRPSPPRGRPSSTRRPSTLASAQPRAHRSRQPVDAGPDHPLGRLGQSDVARPPAATGRAGRRTAGCRRHARTIASSTSVAERAVPDGRGGEPPDVVVGQAVPARAARQR